MLTTTTSSRSRASSEGASKSGRETNAKSVTVNSRGVHNRKRDNAEHNLIMYEGDLLGRSYVVEELLGQGTFGQVVLCSRTESSTNKHRRLDKVAVKVVKNKTSYHAQAKIEVSMLETLNKTGTSSVVLAHEHFLFENHLCIVFELMGINLFEYLKLNSFRGVSEKDLRSICRQVLDACVLFEALNIIHCDLKPENILLAKDSVEGNFKVKVVDLGSSCFVGQTVYSYIQSRFYRAPEVVLGTTYDTQIDTWSLGCIAVELFMGLPVFPGVSEHNLLARISETLLSDSLFPNRLCEKGKQTRKFFYKVARTPSPHRDDSEDSSNECEEPSHAYRLKTSIEYAKDRKLSGPEKMKRYVRPKLLRDIITQVSAKRRPENANPVDNNSFFDEFHDFVRGLLRVDPRRRWRASEAIQHPFVNESAKYTQGKRFRPAREYNLSASYDQSGRFSLSSSLPRTDSGLYGSFIYDSGRSETPLSSPPLRPMKPNPYTPAVGPSRSLAVGGPSEHLGSPLGLMGGLNIGARVPHSLPSQSVLGNSPRAAVQVRRLNFREDDDDDDDDDDSTKPPKEDSPKDSPRDSGVFKFDDES